jgi:membrane fusion protein (multidrug efflux system)
MDSLSHSEPTLAPEIDTVAKQQKQRKTLLTALGAVLAAGLIGFGIYWFAYASHIVSTDNAYVGADTATITPLVNGPVLRVPVSETQHVNVGDILVQLDDSDARLSVAQARADLAAAQSQQQQARVDLQRRRALAPGGAVSADELTTAQTADSAANAAVAAARARLDAAQLELSRMMIRAPVAGVVSDKHVQIGQRVQAGEQLMVVAPITDSYVDANFKESQLRRVAAGQPVTLHADVYGDGVTYHGTVRGLAGGTGSAFSLIPAQNASGNWIKVSQRVPVRINLDPRELAQHPLRVGMSMTAAVDVRAR